jgi:hypothetical protein
MALRWPTEYWAGQALDWIEAGCAHDELSEVLTQAARMPGRSQNFEHRLARLRRETDRS